MKKKHILLFLIILVYRCLLDVQYCHIISFLYAYDGYSVNIVGYKFLLSWIATIWISKELVGLSEKNSYSSLFLLILGLLYFIPGFSLYALNGKISDSYELYYLLNCFLLYSLHKCIPFFLMRLPSEKTQKRGFTILLLVVVCGTFLIMGLYNGFKIKFSISDVYELRNARSNMNLPTIVEYFQPMSAMFVPICMIYFMICKRWSMFLLMIFMQLMSFAFGGLKATFFAIVVAIGAIFYPKGHRYLIVLALCMFSLFGLLEFEIVHSPFLTEIITRRVSFIPNMVGYCYYDFFSTHELLYLRASILRWFGAENPYHEYIPGLIGEYYWGRPMGANTGMFGEAFSQFGWFSSIIYPFLYIYAFRFFDACTKNIDERIVLTAVALLSISFIDGAFWGVMLTEGFILICIVFYYMPRLNPK